MMPFICGTYLHAREVAHQAGLPFCNWRHLECPRQLMGHWEPNVVILDSATKFRPVVLADLHDMLLDRSATIWTEVDLIQGRVPLS